MYPERRRGRRSPPIHHLLHLRRSQGSLGSRVRIRGARRRHHRRCRQVIEWGAQREYASSSRRIGVLMESAGRRGCRKVRARPSSSMSRGLDNVGRVVRGTAFASARTLPLSSSTSVVGGRARRAPGLAHSKSSASALVGERRGVRGWAVALAGFRSVLGRRMINGLDGEFVIGIR